MDALLSQFTASILISELFILLGIRRKWLEIKSLTNDICFTMSSQSFAENKQTFFRNFGISTLFQQPIIPLIASTVSKREYFNRNEELKKNEFLKPTPLF